MDAPPPHPPRGRGVARAAKITLISAAALALIGAGSCAFAFSGAGYDGLGAAIIGLFLLFGAGFLAVVGVALALVAALTRSTPVDPLTGAPLATLHPHARPLVLWTAALIGVGGVLTALESILVARSGASGSAGLLVVPALLSGFGLFGLAAIVLAIVLVALGSQGRLPRRVAAAAGIYLLLRLFTLVLGFLFARVLAVVGGLALWAAADLAIAAFLLVQARALTPSAPPPAPPP